MYGHSNIQDTHYSNTYTEHIYNDVPEFLSLVSSWVVLEEGVGEGVDGGRRDEVRRISGLVLGQEESILCVLRVVRCSSYSCSLSNDLYYIREKERNRDNRNKSKIEKEEKDIYRK